MAIAKVQTISGGTANGTSVALAITATSGNCLLVVMAGTIAGELHVSDGKNTYTRFGTLSWDVDCYYAKNITGGSLTLTVSGTNTAAYVAQVIEFSGVSTTAPIDKSSSTVGGTAWPAGIGGNSTAAATSATDYAVALYGYANSDTTISPSTSRAFTTALSSVTDETQVNQVGSSTCAGVGISHGPIAGLNTEKYNVTTSSNYSAAGEVWVALLTAAAVAPTLKVRRSSTWTAGAVKVRRSSAWVAPTAVKVRRGGAWTTVT